ncbi:MAG: tRNA (adenosine(37)-N6)-dimethylallyltransferase MiaA [Chloroflexi bacterium]|nr:tRNA (adenosine(37)-N6)-dimethylallyltransferase MiaA [Chloroflexota bacterium]
MTTPPATSIPLLAIVGPTAVGKSALAMHLARRFGGEIVNADSRQVYRGMEVGTAAPSQADRAAIPHHLYGIITPDEAFSLARWLPLATAAIEDITERGGLPVVVGGTGQYVNALVGGWQAPRVAPNAELRERLEAIIAQEGVEAAAEELLEADPEAAARIDLRNPRRVVRALEVVAALGPGAHGGQSAPTYRMLLLGLTMSNREELYRRIDDRVDAMLAGGWLDEVRALLDSGYAADLPALSSMGYRELAQHLLGEMSLDEAVRRIKAAHHRLARQQYTWFKPTDARIRWLVKGEGVEEEAAGVVGAWLGEG